MTAAVVAVAVLMATVSIPSILWSLLVGTVLPGLTALVTREHASVRLKALLTAVMAAVTGGLSGFLTAPPHGWPQWEQVISSIAVAWITAVFTYLGAYKPTGLSSYLTRRTAGFGIGEPHTELKRVA